MDLYIKITDENGALLEDVNIYQDGSDSDGAASIKAWIVKNYKNVTTAWASKTKEPVELKRAHGTRYGVTYSVPQWQDICRSLRETGDGFYADDIEARIKSMQQCEAEDCVFSRGHIGTCEDEHGNDLNGDEHFDAKGNQIEPFDDQIPVPDHPEEAMPNLKLSGGINWEARDDQIRDHIASNKGQKKL